MPGASRSRRSVPDIWPGFVDAISTLLIIVIFLLMVFTLAQYFLGEILSGRNEALDRLNRQVVELGEMLALERSANTELRSDVAQLSSELQSSVAAREELTASVASLTAAREALETDRDRLAARLDALVAERDDLRAGMLSEQTRAAEAAAALEDARKTVEADREKITLQLATIESLRRDTEALTRLRAELEAKVGELAATLEARDKALEAERDRTKELQAQLANEKERTLLAQKEIEARDVRLAERGVALTEEQKISAEARQRIALLNRQMEALRQQLARLSTALEASEAKSREQGVQIVNLGKRLNAALASKVEELARYRSEFFGRLREALGDRQDIRIVGDRFVFQSEVLFGSGEGDLAKGGEAQIDQLATALKDIAAKIPKDLDWILRVDGHTDERPISNARFASNWELSSSRAISVVKRLIALGLPPDRVVAAGFGEYQPLDGAHTQTAYRRNRRIEFKLTNR
jgi:chemotaxis protein MotB